MLVFHNVKLITMDSKGIIEKGYIVVRDGRIEKVAEGSDFDRKTFPSEVQIIDGNGGTLIPALIDAHSHLGLFNDSLDMEGSDGNEMTDPLTPQLRAIDGIHNADVCFREAVEGGVGIVMTGPGSGNVLGGQFAIVKTYENTVEDALVLEPAAQKAAFGENPKRVYGKENKTPQTRMGTAALLRQALREAIAYKEKIDLYDRKCSEYDKALARNEEDLPDMPEKPELDLCSESMLSVVEGKLPLKIHAHRQDDLLTAIRICNEFGLTYTLEHCTEGHLISDVLVKEYEAGQASGRGSGYGTGGRLLGVIIGPVIGDRSKPELSNMTIDTAGVLAQAGLPVAVMTDHPCIPQQYLLLSAAIAMRGGLSDAQALESVTIRPAEILGIGDQYGSLSEGKEANLCLFDRHPLDYRAKLLLFVGSGKICYERPYGTGESEV